MKDANNKKVLYSNKLIYLFTVIEPESLYVADKLDMIGKEKLEEIRKKK